MKRRRYLSAAALAVAGVAGCIEDANDGDRGDGSDVVDGGGDTDGTPTGTTTTDPGSESPPQVDWGWTDDPEDDIVVLTHYGGDRVDDPSRIVTREHRGSEYGSLDEQFDGERMSAGDEARVDVPADSGGNIELVWRSSDGAQSQILDTHTYDVR